MGVFLKSRVILGRLTADVRCGPRNSRRSDGGDQRPMQDDNGNLTIARRRWESSVKMVAKFK